MRAVLNDAIGGDVVLAVRMTKEEWALVHKAIGRIDMRTFAHHMADGHPHTAEHKKTADTFLMTVFNAKGTV